MHPQRPAFFTNVQRIAHGFTAIELMVTIAVLAILSAIAVPSLGPIIERWRVRNTAEDLQTSIYLARSEAIKRGGNVTIHAHEAGWSDGWKVVTSINGASEELREVIVSSHIGVALDGGATAISVDRWGMMTNGTVPGAAEALDFIVTPAGKDASDPASNRVCVGISGRVLREPNGSTACPT